MILHEFWQNGAVIQQNKPFYVTGAGDQGESIHVSLIRETDGVVVGNTEVSVENGRFSAELPAVHGSFEPYTLVCEGNSKEERRGLLIGELWLTSGQSNMALPLRICSDKEALLQKTSNDIRFLNCSKPEDETGGGVFRASQPVNELKQEGWMTADSPKTAERLSGVSFSLAAELLERLRVPVGIVSTAVGGTAIEAWLSRESVETSLFLKAYLEKTGRYVKLEDVNTYGERNYTQMSGLFNERIAPLGGIPFGGMVWLQGESSAGSEEEAAYYYAALTELIRSWRTLFPGPLPCILIDIAAENYQFEPLAVAHLNESISRVAQECSDTWEVPVYDLPLNWHIAGTDEGHPIHPTEKGPVGRRAAQVIDSCLFNGDRHTLAPRLKNAEFQGGRVILRFSDVGDGLCCGADALKGFTLCGENGIHMEADARIIGRDTVEVRHPFIKTAAGVTYAYSLYNQNANLFSKGGIPAIPFRKNSVDKVVYTEPREWMTADLAYAYECCFENALGGAGDRLLWKPGNLCGSSDVTVAVQNGVMMEYRTGWQSGYLFGASPELMLAGRYHGLDKVDFLDVEVDNPDDREKQFVGVLIRTTRGGVYYLPVTEDHNKRLFAPMKEKAEGIHFRVDLKSFYGCYLIPEKKEPPDVSDMIAMQFVFKDQNPEHGRVIIRRILPGFYE